ncbi:MAG: ASCH domain-containing protein [Alphaproteobacteria bacterium]|nr:ASCH domain-containing protein [Alphaproteobacteria bacterium]
MHKMKVQTKYYNLLKSGKKIIELRLFDEKRQQIKIGDEIVFSNLSDTNDSFIAQVINLYRAESFDKLCQIITPAQAGFTSKEELITVLQEFYTPDSQQKYGVLGIEIQKI